MHTRIILLFTCLFICCGAFTTALADARAQDSTTTTNRYFKKKPTKREILRMNVEVLRDLSLEEITELADIAGVSSLEELIKLIVTTASKSAESLFDAPLPISAVTGEDIQRAGATSIMEALRLVPGVIVRETVAGNFDIHLRGFDAINPNAPNPLANNSITLVMVNNRIVYNDYQGATFWDNLPFGVNDIERIEVVRGPVSALYGANAVSGVIHFITKQPNSTRGLGASAVAQGGMNSTLLANAALSFAPENSPFSLRLTGNFDSRNRSNPEFYHFRQPNAMGGTLIPGGFQNTIDSRVDPNVRRAEPELATRRLGGTLHAAYTTDDFNLNIMGGYATARIHKPQAVGFAPTFVYFDSTWSAFGHLFGNYKDFSFSVDATTGYLNSLYNPSGPSAINLDWTNINVNLEYLLTFGTNFKWRNGVFARTTAMGTGFMNNRRWDASTSSIAKTGADKTQLVLSYFTKAEYMLDNLRIIGALRVDKFQLPNRFFLSPELAITYKPNSDVLLRASYGRALRTPFMINLYNDFPPTSFGTFALTVQGNQEQLPLTAQSFELGARLNLTDWLAADVEGFLSDLQDLDDAGSVGVVGSFMNLPLVKFSFYNLGMKPRMLGGTISLTASPNDDFRIQAFVTIQNTNVAGYEFREDPANPLRVTRTTDFNHLATPSYYGGIIVNYTPLDKLNINLNGYFYGAQTLEFSNGISENVKMPVDANFLLNATVGYQILDGLQIFANGRNLLGGGQRQYGFADRIGTVVTGGVRLNF